MRAVMVMFDTVSRNFLQNYGSTLKTPNFKRLEEKCCRFDNFYGGSMPCMPARREMHTGQYNFMFRSWGPLEPFDFSVIETLKQNHIYTHLCTDHSHYFEDGGATYHNRFNTWEGFRGQEGDRWVPQAEGHVPETLSKLYKKGISVNQHFANRTRQQTEESMSSVQTMNAGMEFIRNYKNRDDWFLQIESFDPHEPFYVPQKYRSLLDLKDEPILNWPAYGNVDAKLNEEEIKNCRLEYSALLLMCDEYLGKILDLFDELNLWEDTMLIVNTDHGFLIGEHNFIGKNFGPMYNEVMHIPFFIYNPNVPTTGVRHMLAQTVDVAPTLLDYFNVECPTEMDGFSLIPAMSDDQEVRDIAHFGVHGSFSCITDGQMTYMRANVHQDNQPLVDCTLMPTRMRGFISAESLKEMTLVKGTRYSHGIPFLKIPTHTPYDSHYFGDQLFDIRKDPFQLNNLALIQDIQEWKQKLKEGLTSLETPKEELERLGL